MYMATAAQIAANRLNSLKSPGPRSEEGKAASRFNALQSGIHARSQVIPGENAEELEAMAASYREQYRPENPAEVFLVDRMIRADWELRRFERIEAELWEGEFNKGVRPAQAFAKNPAFVLLYRRMDAAERSFYRARKELQQMRKAEGAAKPEAAVVETDGELGSFRQPLTAGPRPGFKGGASGECLPSATQAVRGEEGESAALRSGEDGDVAGKSPRQGADIGCGGPRDKLPGV
jgi:hypothetical protein